MTMKKPQAFTLIELLITVSLTVITTSFATASLVGSAKTQFAVKQTGELQGQVDQVVSKIKKEVQNAPVRTSGGKVRTILTERKNVTYASSMSGFLVGNSQSGYDYSPNSILLVSGEQKDDKGQTNGKEYISAYCLRQDLKDGEVIGQRLVRYMVNVDSSFELNREYLATPECSESYLNGYFGRVYNTPIVPTYLTDASVMVTYFRATPLILSDPNAAGRLLDVDPDAISLEISSMYNDQNSNVAKLGERAQILKKNQPLYNVKTTLLTK